MRVLQINASYKPAYIYGGPTMSVSKLSEQLVKAGHTVSVFTTTANGPVELNVTPNSTVMVDGLPVTYFSRITKDHSHFSPALLRALWQQAKQFDVIHIHAWWNLVSVLSCLVALCRKVPVVVSPRGTLSIYSFHHRNSISKYLFHHLFAKYLLNASTIHTTSPAEQQAMEQLIRAKQVVTVPNFVSMPDSFPANPPVDAGVIKLLFLSRIDKKKGLDILLKALPHLTIPYHLTIAGDGENTYVNELKRLSQENSSAKKISWIGFQNDSDKFNLMAAHDIFILPSHNENFANVVIESLSAGTAVIISRTVGLAQYITDNNFGSICDLDEFSLSDRINRLGNNPDKLNDIASRAPGLVRQHFNGDYLTQQYLDMYKTAIAL